MFEFLTGRKSAMPEPEDALAGRSEPIVTPGTHYVLDTSMAPPFPAETERVIVGMGCFWGAEQGFWKLAGVHTTAVGYAGGYTPNPTYEEVCGGRTGQNEVVLVVFRPEQVSFESVLKHFWEDHDPTQGMRQGNDVGTQYRSSVYFTSEAQRSLAEASKLAYGKALEAAGIGGPITTEIAPAGEFFYAEEYHQQYLAKNPAGYCPVHATGVSCPIGMGVQAG